MFHLVSLKTEMLTQEVVTFKTSQRGGVGGSVMSEQYNSCISLLLLSNLIHIYFVFIFFFVNIDGFPGDVIKL